MTAVDFGVPSLAIEWEMTTWPKGPVRSMFRIADDLNYWWVGGTNDTATTMFLVKTIAGTGTTVATATGITWGVGHVLRVETDAPTGLITVKVNGSVISALTTTSTELATASGAGFGGNRAVATPDLNAARWSRFSVQTL